MSNGDGQEWMSAEDIKYQLLLTEKLQLHIKLKASSERNIEIIKKYDKLLMEYNNIVSKYSNALNISSNLLNGIADYIEELQETRRWWWFSKNINIVDRLLAILATRKNI